MYQSVDSLWMNSLSDRFTKNQIVNPSSQLNKRGLELCNELAKALKKPVYLFVRSPIGGWYQHKKNNKVLRVCPKCAQDLISSKRIETVGKVCECCRLAFEGENEKRCER